MLLSYELFVALLFLGRVAIVKVATAILRQLAAFSQLSGILSKLLVVRFLS